MRQKVEKALAKITRRQHQKVEREFAKVSRSASELQADVSSVMRSMRGMGSGWLATIEEIERDPSEAAGLPVGLKKSCETIIDRSADVELSLGDTLAAFKAAHEAILSIPVEAEA